MKQKLHWMLEAIRQFLMGVVLLVSCCGGWMGCGGGFSPPREPEVEDTNLPEGSSVPATARFHVDVATGKVAITPLSRESGGSQGRAVFTGTAVNFQSSTLLDQGGNVGRKVLAVQMINRSGEPIGQRPDGTVAGWKVWFSGFSNRESFVDLRPLVQVRTLTGTGSAGSADGPAGSASLNLPSGVAVDDEGNAFVADTAGHRIRKVRAGLVSTLAGSGVAGGVNGIGSAARFNQPYGIALHPQDGTLIVADYGGHRIRRVERNGRVTTVAGTGAAGDAQGAGDVATFRHPVGVAVDPNGVIYVAEGAGHRIRKIVQTGGNPGLPASYTVTLLAGSNASPPEPGSTDGVGSGARFRSPGGITLDSEGMLYVADTGNHCIRLVKPTREVATVAGTRSAGTVDGSGEIAQFSAPTGIGFGNGALIISERQGHILRQMRLKEDSAAPGKATSWLVQTLAGSAGTPGWQEGDGTEARFNSPRLLDLDASGNIYVADRENHCLRQLSPTQGFFPLGIVTGSTSSEPVRLANATGMAPNPAGDSLPYITYPTALAPGETSETGEWVFMVPEGVTAFDFTVTVEGPTSFLAPPEAAVGSGSPKVLVCTLAGSPPGQIGYANGTAPLARFNVAVGLAVDALGNVYVTDYYNSAIRRISADGMVSTVAGAVGSGAGWADGFGHVAQFNHPAGVAVTPDGETIYVADRVNHRIRRIQRRSSGDPTNPQSWSVSTIAGTGEAGYQDGRGDEARFSEPYGILLEAGGNLFTTDSLGGNRVRRVQFRGGDPAVATNWWVELVAGSTSGSSGNADGTGSAARFHFPSGLAMDRAGTLFVADYDNHRIRKISNAGGSVPVVTTLAGSTAGYADGTGTEAQFRNPFDLTADAAGFLYVSDSMGRRVRRISPTGVVTTVAGTGVIGCVDGPGDSAQFGILYGIDIDSSGNLYVNDGSGTRIRQIQRVMGLGY